MVSEPPYGGSSDEPEDQIKAWRDKLNKSADVNALNQVASDLVHQSAEVREACKDTYKAKLAALKGGAK